MSVHSKSSNKHNSVNRNDTTNEPQQVESPTYDALHNPPIEQNLVGVFDTINNLVERYRDSHFITALAGDVIGHVSRINSSGIYRNKDIVIIYMSYGYVVSHVEGEVVIDPNQSMLQAMIGISMAVSDREVVVKIAETIEKLINEYNNLPF